MENVLEEGAVADFGGFAGADPAGDGEGEVGEIDAAADEADNWHDEIIDEGIDYGGESAAYGNTYGEIDDGAAIDEFDELFSETAAFFFDGFGFFFDVFNFIFIHNYPFIWFLRNR